MHESSPLKPRKVYFLGDSSCFTYQGTPCFRTNQVSIHLIFLPNFTSTLTNPLQAIPTMSCPDCFKGSIHDGKPAGKEEILHGVRTYIATPTTPSPNPATIILLADAFGFNLPNPKFLADYYANSTHHRVLVPDIIPGGGVPLSTLSLMTTVTSKVPWYNLPKHLKRGICLVRLMTVVLPFAKRTKGAFKGVLAYARAVKAEGGKLGVVGFCWGGMMSMKLCREASVAGGEDGLVDVHFCAHPAGLQTDDFVEGVRRYDVPFSMAIGDRDFVMDRKQVEEVREALKREVKGGRCEVRVYEGCGHGFAVRADRKKKIEDEGAGKAAEQAVEWLKRFLG